MLDSSGTDAVLLDLRFPALADWKRCIPSRDIAPTRS